MIDWMTLHRDRYIEIWQAKFDTTRVLALIID